MRNVKKSVGLSLIGALLASLLCVPGFAFAFGDWWDWGSSVDVRDEAFEIIGKKYVFGLSGKTVEEKRALVMEIGEYLAEHAENSELFVPVALRGETVLKFPYMDMNLDGVADEASCNVEFWHEDNQQFLVNTGTMQYMAALPWPVAIFTDGNYIKAGLRIPETSLRVFMRQESDLADYEELGAEIREDMENLLRWHLAMKGFSTWYIDRQEDTSITEDVLLQVESMLGPITPDLAAPTVSFPANGMSVEDLLTALEAQVNLPRVPDLNGDGIVDAADKAVLPGMFQAFFDGQMSFDDMVQVMLSAPQMWNMGATFQQWKSVKVLEVGAGTNLYQVSVCQPFYAQTALQLTGLYHQTIMPCRLLVWAEDGRIHISVSNPEVFFALFFFDAAPNMTQEMQDLFSIFPTFVLNEMVVLVNSTLTGLGVSEQMAFHPCPCE